MEQLHAPLPVHRASLAGAHVVILEPDRRLAEALSNMLVDADGSAVHARTLESLAELRSGPYDAAIVDADRLGDDAERAVRALLTGSRPCFAAMLSRKAKPDVLQRLMLAGAYDVVFHPLEPKRVIAAMIRTVAATRSLRVRLDPHARPYATNVARVRFAPETLEKASEADIDEAILALGDLVDLSPRECLVLRYIALGYRYDDIGAALSIGRRTVKMHADNLRRKVGARDRFELLRKMYRT